MKTVSSGRASPRANRTELVLFTRQLATMVGSGISLLEGLQLYGPNPQGCPRCNGGYRGRFAILETLFFEEKLRRMVVEGASVHDIKREAVSQGMISLRRVALMNAMRGRTSLEEVLRVTLGDE